MNVLRTAGVAAASGFDEVFVLHDRPLAAGQVLEDTSQVGDDIWQLHPAMLKSHEWSLILRFESLPARYRRVAKELFYALLSAPPPYGQQRHGVTTVRNLFSDAVRFFAWLDNHQEAMVSGGLAGLTGGDLEEYQRYLMAEVASATVREKARLFVRCLWLWREHLASDSLPFDPGHLDNWGEPHPTRSENATGRIPESVLGPLLVWALRFVDEFSADIVAGDRDWRVRVAARTPPEGRRAEDGSVCRDVQALLDDYVARGAPLPGHLGRPSIVELAQLVGCASRSVYRCQDQIDAAFAVVGATSHTTLPTAITATVDGVPWIDAIATHHTRDDGVAALARTLQVAC